MGSAARKLACRQDSDGTPPAEILVRAFKTYFQQPNGVRQCWVLFKNGTAVIMGSAKECSHETLDELASSAKRYLRQHGRTVVGTPVADFAAAYGSDLGGWMVQFQNERILTFLPIDKSPGSLPDTPSTPDIDLDCGRGLNRIRDQSMHFGLLGRMLRQKDAKELAVIYVNKAANL